MIHAIKSLLFKSSGRARATVYSKVPNKSVTFFYSFLGAYTTLLGTTRLFIFGKSSHQYCFLRNKYFKNFAYTPLFRPTYTFINLWENLSPTRLLGPHAY